MVNRVILIGNLGADPEVKSLESGVSVARLRLATSESYKDKNTNEWKENTEWHTITLWRNLAERAESTLRKGMQIYVEGKLSTRKWKDEATGQDKYSTEIVLQGYNSNLTMLDSRGGKSGENNLVSENKSSLPNDDLNQDIKDLDDEIPF